MKFVTPRLVDLTAVIPGPASSLGASRNDIADHTEQ
jgi:hypothetical protein